MRMVVNVQEAALTESFSELEFSVGEGIWVDTIN
jgi:hypothetical protein